MNYAVIENGIVINIVVADDLFAAEHGLIKTPDNVCIGWSYINGQFVDMRPPPETLIQSQPLTKEEIFEQLEMLKAQIANLGD